MLPERLALLEKQLMSTLEHARASFQHAGLRGDQVEAAVREFLGKHLPLLSFVGTGEIIDSSSKVSHQTDIVITNTWHPFQYGLHEPGVYLIEGVAAAGEVKSCLTHKDLDDALQKGRAFKDLHNRVAKGTDDQLTEVLEVTSAPFFVVAFETRVAAETLIARLAEATTYTDDGNKISSPVDAVFILKKGACIDYGDGNQQYRSRYPTKTPLGDLDISGWCWYSLDNVLTRLLAWLHGSISFDSCAHPSAILRYLQPPGQPGMWSIRHTRVRRDYPVDIWDPRSWPGITWKQSE